MLEIFTISIFIIGTVQAGDWPMFHRDSCHTGATDEKIPDELVLLWSYETGSYGHTSPAIVNGKVFVVGSYDDKIYCLDENNGNLIWSVKTRSLGESSPAIADGKVFVGSDYKLYCLDEDNGNLIWHSEIGSHWSSPTVAEGEVFIGSDDEKVYCLDVDDGNLIWSYKIEDTVESSPAVADGKVFVGSSFWDNKIYCLDEDNGNLIWTYETGGRGVSSSPAVADGKVFVGSDDCNIYCLDENTGKLIWRYKTEYLVTSSPAVADGKVFVGSDNKVYCLNKDNGNLIWSYETRAPVDSSPAVSGNRVFVSSWGKIHCLDVDNGNLIWNYEIEYEDIPFGMFYSSPAIADGKVFVSFNDGKIYCFGGKEQLTSASSTFKPEEVYVYLHGDKTDVIVGEEAILSLSTVNLITKPTMTLQLILKVPSGMSISSAEFIESGAGQYTATYTVEPGKERHIGVSIKTNEPGDFTVVGTIAYYFEGDKSTAEYKNVKLPVKVNPISTQTTIKTTPTPSPTKTPGFEPIFAITSLLAVAYLVRRKKKTFK